MKMIKLGIIGTGRIGKIHLENINNLIPDAEVVAVSDPFFKKEDNRGYVVSTTNELINNPQLDAVLICSPTDTHAELIEQAAQAGKHIFCEKPMDLSLERALQTLGIVKKSGVKFMLGFNRRFDPNFMKVKSLVDEGRVGEPHILKITSRDPGPPPVEYIKSSGGLFKDMAIHDFDMSRYIMKGEVTEVFAKGNVLVDKAIGEAGDIDTAVTTLAFDDGSFAVIDNSRKAAYGYDQRLEVFGSKGMARVENEKPDLHELSTVDGVSTSLPLHFFMQRYTQSYMEEIKSFILALKDDKTMPVEGKDGIMALVIAEAANKSLRENRPVKIREIFETNPIPYQTLDN